MLQVLWFIILHKCTQKNAIKILFFSIRTQVVKKNEMYVDWKTTPITYPDYEKVKLNFKGYEKIVLKGIARAKKEYFDRVFVAYKHGR